MGLVPKRPSLVGPKEPKMTRLGLFRISRTYGLVAAQQSTLAVAGAVEPRIRRSKLLQVGSEAVLARIVALEPDEMCGN